MWHGWQCEGLFFVSKRNFYHCNDSLTFLFYIFIPIHSTLSFLLNYSKDLASLLKEKTIRFPLDNLILAKYLCDQTRCLPNCFQVHRPLHYHWSLQLFMCMEEFLAWKGVHFLYVFLVALQQTWTMM